MKVSKEARDAVKQIIDDMTDRRGLRQEWDAIDDDIQKEIRETWQKIVHEAIVKDREKQP